MMYIFKIMSTSWISAIIAYIFCEAKGSDSLFLYFIIVIITNLALMTIFNIWKE